MVDPAPPEGTNPYVDRDLFRRDRKVDPVAVEVQWFGFHERRLLLEQVLAADRHFLEARWALVDLHTEAAAVSRGGQAAAMAAQEKEKALAEHDESVRKIRDRALPFAEERIADLEKRRASR